MESEAWYRLGETLGTVGLGLLTYGAAEFSRWRARRKAGHRSVEELTQESLHINTVLTQCRIFFNNASRAHVSLIENGSYYIDGSEIQKYSRAFEAAADGVSYEARLYQGILIGLMPQEWNLVIEAGPGWRATTDVPDSKFRRMLDNGGVQSVARCAIRRNGQIIGFLGVDWLYQHEKPETIDEMMRFAGKLEQIIMRRK